MEVPSRKKKRFCQTARKEVEQLNYNSEFELVDQEQQAVEYITEVNNEEENDNIIVTPGTSANDDTIYLINSSFANNMNNVESASFPCNENVAATMNNNVELTSRLDAMDNKIDALLDFVIKSKAETKALFQEVLRKIDSKTDTTGNDITQATNKDSVISEFNFPLDNTNAIDELENKLADKEFEQKMLIHFTSIGGDSGKQNGEKVAVRIISELFTNSVLCQYTWKGISTSKTEEGRPNAVFIKNDKIISFLFKILQKADQKFTRLATEKFLQFKVFKRNFQRLKREIEKKRKANDENSENLNPGLVQVENAAADESVDELANPKLDPPTVGREQTRASIQHMDEMFCDDVVITTESANT